MLVHASSTLLRAIRLLCVSLLLLSLPAQADRLTEQRRQYDQARAALERGDMERFNSLSSALTDYPLYPYLVMESLRKRLDRAPHGEIEQFLSRHGDLPAASSIKATWLKRLHRSEERRVGKGWR